MGSEMCIRDRDDEGWVEIYQCLSQRRKLAIPPPHLNLARPYRVGDVAAAAFGVLTCIYNLNLELGMLVEYLLYPTVVAALPWLYLGTSRALIVELLIAQVAGPGNEVGLIW